MSGNFTRVLISLVFILFSKIAFGQGSVGAQASSLKFSDETQGETSNDRAAPLPVFVEARLSTWLGGGTFVLGPATNPYVATGATLSTGFEFGRLSFFASHQTWVEWTKSDQTTSPYQGQMLDPMFQLRYGFLDHPSWNISGGISIVQTVPLSMISRQSGSLGGGGGAFDFSWTAPFFDITPYVNGSLLGNAIVPSLSSGFARDGFYDMVYSSGDNDQFETCIRRSDAELGHFACSALPSIAIGTAGLGLRGGLLDGRLTLDVSSSMMSFVSAFWGPDDEMTSVNAKPGPGIQLYSSGLASMTVAVWPWLAFSTGVWSMQPALSADGNSFRFPFWDFVSARQNYSVLFFEVILSH